MAGRSLVAHGKPNISCVGMQVRVEDVVAWVHDGGLAHSLKPSHDSKALGWVY
jgi:hypothetical protein